MRSEDLIYEKHYFNRYGTTIYFISNFLTEVTDIYEIYEMLNELKSEKMK